MNINYYVFKNGAGKYIREIGGYFLATDELKKANVYLENELQRTQILINSKFTLFEPILCKTIKI